jgi:chromosome segregation ATPase
MQQTIEKQEQQKIRLLADRELVQRHLDSVQDSTQDVLAKAEQTMQLLHAHEQRLAQQAHAQVSTAQDRAAEQEVKLSAQNMVAESLSKRVMQLTGERDAATATVQQQEEQIQRLTEELELRQSIDDVRYDHECHLQEIHLKHIGRRELIVNRWSEDKSASSCCDVFNHWHIMTKNQRIAALRDTIRSKYFLSSILTVPPKSTTFELSCSCPFACLLCLTACDKLRIRR